MTSTADEIRPERRRTDIEERTMMTARYRIEHYPADGHDDDPNYMPELHGRECVTLTEARKLIKQAVGNHGHYRDPEGHENWHESKNDGCGGYSIVALKQQDRG